MEKLMDQLVEPGTEEGWDRSEIDLTTIDGREETVTFGGTFAPVGRAQEYSPDETTAEFFIPLYTTDPHLLNGLTRLKMGKAPGALVLYLEDTAVIFFDMDDDKNRENIFYRWDKINLLFVSGDYDYEMLFKIPIDAGFLSTMKQFGFSPEQETG